MADMKAKGRSAKGARHGAYTKPESRTYGLSNGAYTHPEKRVGIKGVANVKAKLTEASVIAIRERYARGDGNQYSLAKEYGVCQSVLFRIIHRKSWKHV
jgi:hypothetical protein